MRQTIYLLAASLKLVPVAPIPQVLGPPAWTPFGNTGITDFGGV